MLLTAPLSSTTNIWLLLLMVISVSPRFNHCRVRNWRGAGPCGWARFQFLPIRTTREVFPQAAHPTKFFGRVMCRRGHGGHFHAYAVAEGKGWIFQSQYNPSTP